MAIRVYYLCPAQFAISNIALRRIKIARFSDLNDPFELLAVNVDNKEHRSAFRRTKEQINKDRGLICFTRGWKNPLIWGHYADRHTGICLGFDVPDDDDLLAPVIYARAPMKIQIDLKTNKPNITEDMMNKLLRTKFYDWKYEDELRLFVALDHTTVESGMYFFPFGSRLALREIILGPRCEIPISSVRSLVSSYSPSVTVIKSRMAYNRFAVVENKVASR